MAEHLRLSIMAAPRTIEAGMLCYLVEVCQVISLHIIKHGQFEKIEHMHMLTNSLTTQQSPELQESAVAVFPLYSK